MASLLSQGKTAIRDSIKSIVSHVGVSSDTTPFNEAQSDLSPDAGAMDLIKTATISDVDAVTFDASLTIEGDTEFTNQTINTIGILQGATSSDAISRSVRTVGIGVQSGDIFTIGVRVKVEDNS